MSVRKGRSTITVVMGALDWRTFWTLEWKKFIPPRYPFSARAKGEKATIGRVGGSMELLIDIYHQTSIHSSSSHEWDDLRFLRKKCKIVSYILTGDKPTITVFYARCLMPRIKLAKLSQSGPGT
jgi:hypothetical protein